MKFEKNNGYYDLERVVGNAKEVKFIYFCNHQDDYVEGEHNGKKYSVDFLKTIAEDIIDLIQKSEKDWEENMIKNGNHPFFHPE